MGNSKFARKKNKRRGKFVFEALYYTVYLLNYGLI